MAQSANITFDTIYNNNYCNFTSKHKSFRSTLDVTTYNAGTTNTIDFGDGTTADKFADALAVGAQARVLATSDVSQIGNLIDTWVLQTFKSIYQLYNQVLELQSGVGNITVVFTKQKQR